MILKCCWARDLQTTHGTYVNEERLAGERELCLGDTVRVADYSLRLALASEPDSGRGRPLSLPAALSKRTVLLALLALVVLALLIALALLRPWDRFPGRVDAGRHQRVCNPYSAHFGKYGSEAGNATVAHSLGADVLWDVRPQDSPQESEPARCRAALHTGAFCTQCLNLSLAGTGLEPERRRF